KAIDHIRRQQALKRGAGAVRGDSFATGLNQLVEKQSQHELEVEFVEHLNATLAKLNDPILLQVVKAKLEGHKNNEISEKIGRSISSVERKLRLARTIFEEEYYVS
ncbi:MAG: ECF-type sigma factor, partial [Planctomycetota bacterium]